MRRLLDFAALGSDSGSLRVSLWAAQSAVVGPAPSLGSLGCPCCGGPGICVFVVVLSASWRGQVVTAESPVLGPEQILLE